MADEFKDEFKAELARRLGVPEEDITYGFIYPPKQENWGPSPVERVWKTLMKIEVIRRAFKRFEKGT